MTAETKYLVVIASRITRIVSGPHESREMADLAAQEINSRLTSAPWAEVCSTPCRCSTCAVAA
jgi:hypothetical protein